MNNKVRYNYAKLRDTYKPTEWTRGLLPYRKNVETGWNSRQSNINFLNYDNLTYL